MREGIVEHHDGYATVRANEPRPLQQAIAAVAKEYCWAIDFEDPPYESDYDLVPGDTGGSGRIPAGAAFQSDFPEDSTTAASSSEEQFVLNRIVSDYNQSGNPGKFRVVEQSDGSYTVVGDSIRDMDGHEKSVPSLLDTKISLATETRSVNAMTEAISQAVSAQSGFKVDLINEFWSANAVVRAPKITIGGTNIPARDLLLQALKALGVRARWEMRYGADSRTFVVNIAPRNPCADRTPDRIPR
jgi:hypothetical protein